MPCARKIETRWKPVKPLIDDQWHAMTLSLLERGWLHWDENEHLALDSQIRSHPLLARNLNLEKLKP